jgi:hypothetical protein
LVDTWNQRCLEPETGSALNEISHFLQVINLPWYIIIVNPDNTRKNPGEKIVIFFYPDSSNGEKKLPERVKCKNAPSAFHACVKVCFSCANRKNKS